MLKTETFIQLIVFEYVNNSLSDVNKMYHHFSSGNVQFNNVWTH